MSDPELTTVTGAQTQSLQLAAEPTFQLIDLAVVGIAVLVALWYLYRILWARRGGCSGCAKGSKGACAVKSGDASNKPRTANGVPIGQPSRTEQKDRR